MDVKRLRDGDIVFDIESGATTSEDLTWGVAQEKQLLNRFWSGSDNAKRAVRGQEAAIIGNVPATCVDVPMENVELENKFPGEENVGVVEKMGDEQPKTKKKACQKPPKPPRPPKAPSLDAADQKLIREISELAMLKRARMERVKNLKKMKNAKPSSSNTNFCALVVTILFCLVIFWQVAGFCSRCHPNMRFEGSPELSVRGGFISVWYARNVFPSANRSTSASPDIIEQVSGLGLDGEGEDDYDFRMS